MQRAQRLQIGSFSQPVGPGELQMPSIRGVGGSLLYFMQQGRGAGVWEHEFVADSRGRKRGTRACCGSTMSRRPCNTKRCFPGCSTTFRCSTSARRHRSRSPIRSDSCTARPSSRRTGSFASRLNSSAAAQTLSARFLQGFLGAGVQHIALATRDIFFDARRAEGARPGDPADPAELLRGSQRALRPESGAASSSSRPAISFTTATGRANTSSCIRAHSPSGFSSRSWSGAITRPMAARTPPSGSPRNRAIAPISSSRTAKRASPLHSPRLPGHYVRTSPFTLAQKARRRRPEALWRLTVIAPRLQGSPAPRRSR